MFGSTRRRLAGALVILAGIGPLVVFVPPAGAAPSAAHRQIAVLPVS